jgi:hypothetical protein
MRTGNQRHIGAVLTCPDSGHGSLFQFHESFDASGVRLSRVRLSIGTLLRRGER